MPLIHYEAKLFTVFFCDLYLVSRKQDKTNYDVIHKGNRFLQIELKKK